MSIFSFTFFLFFISLSSLNTLQEENTQNSIFEEYEIGYYKDQKFTRYSKIFYEGLLVKGSDDYKEDYDFTHVLVKVEGDTTDLKYFIRSRPTAPFCSSIVVSFLKDTLHSSPQRFYRDY
jgi:hypothetical protein